MTTTVISHRMPRRKRAGAWAYAGRRLGALAFTAAALAAASWLGQLARAPAPPPLETTSAPPAPRPALQEIDIALDLASEPAPRQRRARRRAVVTPTSAAAPDGFEVLSAAELEAISQAHQ